MINNEKWRDSLVKIDSSIGDAINSLNRSSTKIVLVVSHDDEFVGTVSDGDIRRGLLKGLNIKSPISDIVHRDAFVAPPELRQELVIGLMQANKVHQIPVVDKHRRVIGLHLWEQISACSNRKNLIVIIAGGKGIRLRPHTDSCPKPLLTVAGKPILEHIIGRARSEGFSNFVIAINYLGNMIEEYFGNGENFGVNIRYIKETAPLGTAGALSLLGENIGLPFIVTNGDIITDVRYGELLDFHISHNSVGSMAVRAHEWQNPFGVVKTSGIDIVELQEKPMIRSYINAGVYALSPSVLNYLMNGVHCDMPSLFDLLRSKSLRTVAYPMHEQWLDVGNPSDLEFANSNN